MRDSRSTVEKIRSAIFLHNLAADLNLNAVEIHQLLNTCYYEFVGFPGPTEETVSQYFKGRRGPEYDPPWPGILGWVAVVELLFEGATDVFFHPLWNLIEHRLVSSNAYVSDIQAVRTTPRPISRLRRSVGLWTPNELARIHSCMLQLPLSIRRELFAAPDRPFELRRKMRSIDDEVAGLEDANPIDRMGLLVALLLEAIELADDMRIKQLHMLVEIQLPELLRLPSVEAVKLELEYQIRLLFDRKDMRSRNILLAISDGYPESWTEQAFERLVREYASDPVLLESTIVRATELQLNELEMLILLCLARRLSVDRASENGDAV